MSRLPVIHTAWALLLVTALFVPLIVQAQMLPQTQHLVVSSLSQLEDDKNVRQYREIYLALSGANLIYGKCTKELDIEDSDQAYLKQKFTDVSQNYVRAYQDAYVDTTGAAPPQSFMNDVAATLTARQQDAVDNVALIIREKGCGNGRLRPFVKYVETLHKQDRDAANAKPVAPAQPYQ